MINYKYHIINSTLLPPPPSSKDMALKEPSGRACVAGATKNTGPLGTSRRRSHITPVPSNF